MKAVLTTDRIIEVLRGGPRTYRGLVQELEMEWRDLPSDIGEKLKVAVADGIVTVINDPVRGRLYALPERKA